MEELFEDLALMLDARVNDQFTHFGVRKIKAEDLGMGVARSIECTSMETRVSCKAIKSEEHRTRIESHLRRLNEGLMGGEVNSKQHRGAVDRGAVEPDAAKDGSRQGGRFPQKERTSWSRTRPTTC